MRKSITSFAPSRTSRPLPRFLAWGVVGASPLRTRTGGAGTSFFSATRRGVLIPGV